MEALPCERRVDRARLPFRPTPRDRQIFLRDPLLLHEQTETPGSSRVLCHQDQPARLAIQPVHDGNLPAVRDFEREKLFELAPKRPHAPRFRRMHEQKRRLIDNDEILPLGDNGKIVSVVCARSIRGG